MTTRIRLAACLVLLLCIQYASSGFNVPFSKAKSLKGENKWPLHLPWLQKVVSGVFKDEEPKLRPRGSQGPPVIVAASAVAAIGLSQAFRSQVFGFLYGIPEMNCELTEYAKSPELTRQNSPAPSLVRSDSETTGCAPKPRLRHGAHMISLKDSEIRRMLEEAQDGNVVHHESLHEKASQNDTTKEGAQAEPLTQLQAPDSFAIRRNLEETHNGNVVHQESVLEKTAQNGTPDEAVQAEPQTQLEVPDSFPEIPTVQDDVKERRAVETAIAVESEKERRDRMWTHEYEPGYQGNIVYAHEMQFATPSPRRGNTPFLLHSRASPPRDDPTGTDARGHSTPAKSHDAGALGTAANLDAGMGSGCMPRADQDDEACGPDADRTAASLGALKDEVTALASASYDAAKGPEETHAQQCANQDETPEAAQTQGKTAQDPPITSTAAMHKHEGSSAGVSAAQSGSTDNKDQNVHLEQSQELQSAPEGSQAKAVREPDDNTDLPRFLEMKKAVGVAVEGSYITSGTLAAEAANSIDVVKSEDNAEEKRSWAHALVMRTSSFARMEHAPLDVTRESRVQQADVVELGCLLLARPEVFRFQEDRQLFDQSVIVVVQHDEKGTTGFIINRPSAYKVGDVTDDFGTFAQNPVYVGGNVGETVYILHGVSGIGGSTQICDGVFMGGAEEAVKLIESNSRSAHDFRFFYKYATWGPGQLEAEIKQGAWRLVKTSPDVIVNTPSYEGMHLARCHKVFWHQLHQTAGGHLKEISEETIVKEEKEFKMFKTWEKVFQDKNPKVALNNHEEVELGALVLAKITNDLQPTEVSEVLSQISLLVDKVRSGLPSHQDPGESARSVLQALSAVFFTDFEIVDKAAEDASHESVQDSSFIHQVLERRRGSLLALAPVYMALARHLGVPLRLANCSAQCFNPVEFLLRWDDRDGRGTEPLIVDLSQKGLLLSLSEALDRMPSDTSSQGLSAVPHVQLYTRFMHTLARSFHRSGDQKSTLLWLEQLRVLQDVQDEYR